MENATKALLIAAAVLIAIVLIALGVRLLDSAGDTSKQADKVGAQIGETVTNRVTEINGLLSGL